MIDESGALFLHWYQHNKIKNYAKAI